VRYVIRLSLLLLAAAAGGGCLEPETNKPKTDAPKAPKSGDGSPVEVARKPAPADNSFCFVCHLNYKKDELARRHAKGGIGCTYCHGESDEHSSDEDGLTAPELMFAPREINPSCMRCHKREKIAKEEAHESVLAEAAGKKKLCTDCHGKHRLKARTRRWDKATGKVVAAAGVRMSSDHPADR